MNALAARITLHAARRRRPQRCEQLLATAEKLSRAVTRELAVMRLETE